MIPLKFRAQVAQQTHGRNKIVTVAAHPSYEVGQLSPVITGLYLVSGLDFLFSHSVGNVIIPTDELIFFRGVGIPPTRYNSTCPTEFAELITHLQRHEPRRKNSTMWSLHVRNVMLLVVISWLKFILSPTVVKNSVHLCAYIYMFIYICMFIYQYCFVL